jgi:hypothetical protein
MTRQKNSRCDDATLRVHHLGGFVWCGMGYFCAPFTYILFTMSTAASAAVVICACKMPEEPRPYQVHFLPPSLPSSPPSLFLPCDCLSRSQGWCGVLSNRFHFPDHLPRIFAADFLPSCRSNASTVQFRKIQSSTCPLEWARL